MALAVGGYHFSPITEDDLEWAREMHNDPDVLRMLTDPHVVTETEQVQWFENLKKSTTSKRLVVYCTSKFIYMRRVGLIRLDHIDNTNRSVCVGLDICRPYRGTGLAKPIYAKLLKHLFLYQGFNRLWLLVAEYNTVAINLYKQIGFKQEGILRKALLREDCFYNYIMMSFLREDYNDTAL